jgi:hypothetical protein
MPTQANPVNSANYVERLQQGASNDIVERYSNLNSINPFKGPTARSLFYEAGKRNPGKYGQFLFYSLGNNENDFIDAYYRSESADFNRNVSSLKSKNPSAGFLVRQTADLDRIASSATNDILGLPSTFEQDIVGGLSAPYYWKDFLYCKYYGTIPNNYMITLRRFPTPILDNLSIPDSVKQSDSYSKEGAGRPVAQAVTWFGGNTGNTLSTLIQFTTGLSWEPKTQDQAKETEAFSKGFFQDLPYQWFSAAARAATGNEDIASGISSIAEGTAVAFDPNNQTIEGLRFQQLRDRAKDGTLGVMSEFIWVPLDVVQNTKVRGVGLSFTGGTLDIVFEYELTSVGEVNTKAAMLDIMANLLSIGTNYGNFLTPETRYKSTFPAFGFPGGDDGLATFYRNPLQFLLKYGDKLVNPVGNAVSAQDDVVSNGEVGEGTDAATDSQSALTELRGILEKLNTEGLDLEKVKDLASKFGTGFSRLLKLSVTKEFTDNWQVPASLLTGAPIGEWHLTIGNPCNPIAMIGNLVCSNVKIEFGDVLGPDDFPTLLKATFTLEHGRDRERGEIESMFNRGDGRLYSSSASTSSSVQSFSAFSDVNGNVLSENLANQYMQGDAFNTTYGLEEQLGPINTEE